MNTMMVVRKKSRMKKSILLMSKMKKKNTISKTGRKKYFLICMMLKLNIKANTLIKKILHPKKLKLLKKKPRIFMINKIKNPVIKINSFKKKLES